jgi:hypothetical protein
VVAPSGQEGPAAGAFGTIGSPGAAAAALAVAPLSDPRALVRTTLTLGPVTVKGAAVLAGSPPRRRLRAATRDGLAVVRVGANAVAQAAQAAGKGVAAVMLAEPRPGRPLPSIPVGRVPVPVLGVSGQGAKAILDLDPGAPAETTGLTGGRPGPAGRASRFASQGPAFDGTAKPDLARAGSVVAAGRLVSGGAVAAARVAAEAAKLGGGDPRATRSSLLAQDAAAPGTRPVQPAPDVPVGPLKVRRSKRSTGVEFTVGAFERGDPAGDQGTTIVPAQTLELTLERLGAGGKGIMVERLTPAGGERGVLPGEYAYTLPGRVVRDLQAGRYAFKVRARAPRQSRATVATSAPFTVS